MIRWSIRVAMALVLFGISLFALWMGGEGLINGAVQSPAKYESRTVYREIEPVVYSLFVAFWVGSGVGLSYVAYRNLKE